MTAGKHTPAPWDISVASEVGSTWPARFLVDGGNILTFGSDGEEGIYANNPADVALIAAAPDLLAACRGALAAFEDLGIDATHPVHLLRAAIKKARGG